MVPTTIKTNITIFILLLIVFTFSIYAAFTFNDDIRLNNIHYLENVLLAQTFAVLFTGLLTVMSVGYFDASNWYIVLPAILGIASLLIIIYTYFLKHYVENKNNDTQLRVDSARTMYYLRRAGTVVNGALGVVVAGTMITLNYNN